MGIRHFQYMIINVEYIFPYFHNGWCKQRYFYNKKKYKGLSVKRRVLNGYLK